MHIGFGLLGEQGAESVLPIQHHARHGLISHNPFYVRLRVQRMPCIVKGMHSRVFIHVFTDMHPVCELEVSKSQFCI